MDMFTTAVSNILPDSSKKGALIIMLYHCHLPIPIKAVNLQKKMSLSSITINSEDSEDLDDNEVEMSDNL